MKLLRIGTLLAIVALPLLASAPAMADPPPTNPNISVWDFACSRGSETLAFQAAAISQNQSLAGKILDGTGVVHMSPGHGENNQNACNAVGIPTICPLDEHGSYTAEIKPWVGQSANNFGAFEGRERLTPYVR